MPPEVWTKELWTGKGDVHCLGVVMYQFYTGLAAFPGKSFKAMRAATLDTHPDLTLLESRSRDLRSLVGKM
eukprot:840728-Amphidinium_carterae.1